MASWKAAISFSFFGKKKLIFKKKKKGGGERAKRKKKSSHSAVTASPGRWTGNNIFSKGGLRVRGAEVRR